MLKKYEQLAHDIEQLIATGTLQSGDRLPSVRETVTTRGVSPSTVFEAYYLLEARGRIEARPRAGYFVKAQAGPARDEPSLAEPPAGLRDVAINDLVVDVLASVRQRGVFPLGSAFPSPGLFPLDRVARGMASAMRRLEPEEVLESLTPGNEELRRQLALRYVATGTLVGTDEIVVTSGALEALNLSLQVLTRPGDVVAIEAPAFYGCLQALERLQLKAVEVATHPRHGVQVASLAAVLERHPVKACWFMPNFQNPLGALMPPEAKKEMVELLARHQVPLIEDDVYAELYFGVRRPPPAKSFDREGWVLHCSSFSKSLAPGYRLGWVAAGRFARQIERLKLATTVSVAVPSQMAALEFLRHGAFDKHLRNLRSVLEQQQQRAIRVIAKHFPAGTRVTQPEGGYFVWVELPEGVDALQLHRLALSQNISTAPGHLFSADGRFRHHLRLNCGHPRADELEEALRTVGRLATGLLRP